MNRFRMPAVALVLFVFSAATAHAEHACDPPPVPVPEYCSRDDGIILLDWTYAGSTEILYWQQEIGFDAFNLYRGRLKLLVDANHDGALDSYGTCLSELMTSTSYWDPDAPPVGDAYLYIVSGLGAGGESGFGAASNGVPRPNASPCSSEQGHPVIEWFGAVTGPGDGHAVCDETQYFKGLLCNELGIPADYIQSFPTLTLTVDFTETHLMARVIDPDSTPAQNDVIQATARYQSSSRYPEVVVSEDLLDDGGVYVNQVPQRYPDRDEACSSDPICPTCQRALYPVTSRDASIDDTWSSGLALVTTAIQLEAPAGVQADISMALAFDCITDARGSEPRAVDYPVGAAIDFELVARDRAGHVTLGDTRPSVTLEQARFSCSGDECACCLMLSDNPAVECAGRPGLVGIVGSGFENGLCVTFF